MKFRIAENKTPLPNAAWFPILNLAYAVAFANRKPSYVPRTINVRLRPILITWYGRYDDDGVMLGFSKNVMASRAVNTHIGTTPCLSFSEMVAGVAAWMFAGCMGHGQNRNMLASVTREAIMTARAKPDLEAKMEEAIKTALEKPNLAFARQVLRNMEHSSLDYKLAQIAKKEKAWQRKLKLAQTKLAKLARSRSALIAADKRKQKVESPA